MPKKLKFFLKIVIISIISLFLLYCIFFIIGSSFGHGSSEPKNLFIGIFKETAGGFKTGTNFAFLGLIWIPLGIYLYFKK